MLNFDFWYILAFNTHFSTIFNNYPLLTRPSAASDPQINFCFRALCVNSWSSMALWLLHWAVCLLQGMAPPAGTGQTSMHRHCTITHAFLHFFPFLHIFLRVSESVILKFDAFATSTFWLNLAFFFFFLIHIKLDILNVKESVIFTINLPDDGKIVKTQMLIVLSLFEFESHRSVRNRWQTLVFIHFRAFHLLNTAKTNYRNTPLFFSSSY